MSEYKTRITDQFRSLSFENLPPTKISSVTVKICIGVRCDDYGDSGGRFEIIEETA